MGAPSQTQPVDFGAMFKRLSTADKVIGASLILLLIDSFISTWFHYSIDNCGGLSSQFSSACSSTYGSLWGDLGIVAALLLLVAIAFYVIRLFFSTQVELPALPLPDWQLWMAFGVMRALLFVIAAQFLFGYIVFLCPEPLFLVGVPITGIWFLLFIVLDTLLVGYIVTLLVAAFRHARA